MEKVTNIAPGPRGLNTADGPVMLQPGETAEVKLEGGNLVAAKATGWFKFGGQSAKETDKAYDTMNDEELKAILTQHGITADGRWGHDKLVAEAKKAQSKA